MFLEALVFLLPIFSIVDVWYFLRGTKVFLQSLFSSELVDILGEQHITSIVLPFDMDFLHHMNNARYLRECDFARINHLMKTGILMASIYMRARMVVSASNIRYRRSLGFCEAFEIRTKMIGWDDKAFYMEFRFVSKRDRFVSAILLSKLSIVGCCPEAIINYIWNRNIACPELPEDLKHWISGISASSDALRAESRLVEKVK